MSLHRPFWPHSRAYEICRSLTITHLYAPSSQGSRSCALALSFLVHAVLPPSLPSPALQSFPVRFGSSTIAFKSDFSVLSRLLWPFRHRFRVRLSSLPLSTWLLCLGFQSGLVFVLSRPLDPSIELPSPALRLSPATRPFRRASQVRLFYPSSFAWHFRRRFQFLFLVCCTSRTSRTSAWVVVIWRIPHLERVPFARVCSGKTPSSHYTLVSVSDSISAIASDWVSR